VEEALKAGITDYTFKPVDFDELNRKVAYYLGITFGRRRTALIVDDDEIIVKMLRYALFDERFSFICASSGVEALQLAKEYKPDVILTDYLMPGMDGWAFCRHLKTDDVTKDIPIVMISSLSSELDLKKGTVLQVDDYVTKPFTPDMVKRAVNLVLLKKQARLQENRNKELETELSIGRELQKKLMPSADFAIENILQIKSRWLPARHLGGDFYCIFDNHRSEKRVQLLVADVSGKGLGAALLATASQACLRTSVRFTTSPAQLLQQLNAFLLDEQDMETFFVTVFAADIDYGNGILTYASAGHNQMFFRRSSGEIEALHTENLPCGLIHSEVYQELTINMSPGDTLMLYTDGVSEALSPERQVYGEERIRRIMEENSKDFFNILLTDLVNFTGDELQHDDITLIEAAMI
jgi:sigma-B regulation protein RsbU (phosphoserine phosphatase)